MSESGLKKTLVTERISSKKLSEYDLEKSKNWIMLLRYIWKTIGLPTEKYPTGEDFSIITSSVVRGFGDLTMLEFKTAFELAVDGKLSLTSDQINHFHAFSYLYVSTILNAYIEWRKPVINEVNRIRVDQENQPKKQSPEEILETTRRFLFNAIAVPYQKFVEGESLDFGIVGYDHIYRTLEDMGMITLSSDQKKQVAKYYWDNFDSIARTDLHSDVNSKIEYKAKEKIKLILSGKNPEGKKEMVKSMSRKHIVKEFFTQHKEEKRDVLKTLGIKEWFQKKISKNE